MAKLTQAQVRSIETVLYHIDRARAYIAKPETVLAVVKSRATTTLDFDLPDGRIATEIAKDIGSDIVGLSMARDYLANFLKFHAA